MITDTPGAQLPRGLAAGFLVDCRTLTAKSLIPGKVDELVSALDRRKALSLVGCPDSPADEGCLVAYTNGEQEPDFGIVLRPIPNEDDIVSIPGKLCALLLMLVADPTVPQIVFTEAALALRATQAIRQPTRVPSCESGQLTQRQRARASAWVRDHLDQPITETDVARACGMSVAAFTRALRATLGMPLKQWIIHTRIVRAKALLADQRTPLRDIALACGYAEQTHFTRQFTRLVGAPPGAWRRGHRRDAREPAVPVVHDEAPAA